MLTIILIIAWLAVGYNLTRFCSSISQEFKSTYGDPISFTFWTILWPPLAISLLMAAVVTLIEAFCEWRR